MSQADPGLRKRLFNLKHVEQRAQRDFSVGLDGAREEKFENVRACRTVYNRSFLKVLSNALQSSVSLLALRQI